MSPSPEFPFESRFVGVNGSQMHYVEVGEGDPILFLHGNPTSSYLWRNVIPHVAGQGRAIAVDLIGMGKSDKPDIDYRFFDHLEYLEAFVAELELTNVTLVVHDWGGGLGLSYARRHPDNVRGIAFMEAVVKPMSWDETGLVNRFVFKRMRDPKKGDRMNLDKNFFVKRLMPMMVGRKLTDVEKAAYAEPYPTRESRQPVAMWPREIPISGEPADMHSEISQNYEWFQTVSIPKLFLYAEPGVIFNNTNAAEIKDRVANLDTVFIGKGKHYVQEDEPDAIGRAISSWIRERITP
jgi:haloalkane dehalogenase